MMVDLNQYSGLGCSQECGWGTAFVNYVLWCNHLVLLYIVRCYYLLYIVCISVHPSAFLVKTYVLESYGKWLLFAHIINVKPMITCALNHRKPRTVGNDFQQSATVADLVLIYVMDLCNFWSWKINVEKEGTSWVSAAVPTLVSSNGSNFTWLWTMKSQFSVANRLSLTCCVSIADVWQGSETRRRWRDVREETQAAADKEEDDGCRDTRCTP